MEVQDFEDGSRRAEDFFRAHPEMEGLYEAIKFRLLAEVKEHVESKLKLLDRMFE